MKPVILFKSLVGSRAHNLHTEASDYDYRYVQVSPLRDALSPFKNLDTKAKTDGDKDDAIWELSAFCKYAANGNPSVYEALYSNYIEFDALHNQHELVKELLKNKHKFLDARRVYDAHRGYASAQLKKINWDDACMRTRKATVAYIRVLLQGHELLSTGTCNLQFSTENMYRTIFMEIKENGFFCIERRAVENLMKVGELRITRAFENTVLTTPDYGWIEDFIERAYVTLGSRL